MRMIKSKRPFIAVVVVAAGRGARAGGTQAKQWQYIAGRRVFDHTIDVFRARADIGKIVVCLHADDVEHCPEDCMVAKGGTNRTQSVWAGLRALLPHQPDLVLIHDVARPCVSHDVIDRVIEGLDQHNAVAPALPVTDALWTGDNGMVTGTRDRQGLYRAQTPQGFRFIDIFAAHEAHIGQAADDVAVARLAGLDVAIVKGDEDNLKITHPPDFDRAARILETRNGHQAG